MTVVLEMRDRIAAAAMQVLRERSLPSGADIAYVIADRALAGTNFEALVNYTAAVEAGTDPAIYRAALSGDPIIDTYITP